MNGNVARQISCREVEMHGKRLLGALSLPVGLCVACLEALWCWQAAACSAVELHRGLVGCCCSYMGLLHEDGRMHRWSWLLGSLLWMF